MVGDGWEQPATAVQMELASGNCTESGTSLQFVFHDLPVPSRCLRFLHEFLPAMTDADDAGSTALVSAETCTHSIRSRHNCANSFMDHIIRGNQETGGYRAPRFIATGKWGRCKSCFPGRKRSLASNRVLTASDSESIHCSLSPFVINLGSISFPAKNCSISAKSARN